MYAHGYKELPPQLYRANVSRPILPSQPMWPSEHFPYISQPANGGLVRLDRQSPDLQFGGSQAKFADRFWRMSRKLRS
jgi:hypothetical protein